MTIARETFRAAAWGVLFTAVLAVLIVMGSRGLEHFDAALVGYTFATLFATFGITYRYAMWLERPPTRMYWRRGWQAFMTKGWRVRNVARLAGRAAIDVGGNRVLFARSWLRGAAHWPIVWGCLSAGHIPVA